MLCNQEVNEFQTGLPSVFSGSEIKFCASSPKNTSDRGLRAECTEWCLHLPFKSWGVGFVRQS